MNKYLIVILTAIAGCIKEILTMGGEVPEAPAAPEAPDAQTVAAGAGMPEVPVKDPVVPEPTLTPTDAKLDVEGIPWDKRIHSSGKTLYISGAKAGQWKLARGVDAVLVAQVKTELAGGFKGTAGDDTPLLDITKDMMAQPGAPVAIDTWAQLVTAITAAGILPEVVQAACDKFNVQNLGALQDVPILVPMIVKELGLGQAGGA